ncbi:MAG: response regulator [Nitrospirota bacterium]|nr:response regulator [Nitrospirota bacterium]
MATHSIRTPVLLAAALSVVAGFCAGLIPVAIAWRRNGLPGVMDYGDPANVPVYVGLGGLALVTLFAAHVAVNTMVARVRSLRSAVRRATEGRPSHPISTQGNDELADIARAVNRVTEKATQIEQQGRRASLRLAALLEQAPDPLLLLDRDGRVADANVRARALLGRERPELAALELVELIPAETAPREAFFHAFTDCVTAGATRLFDTQLLAADGKPVAVEIHLAPIWGLRGIAAQAVVRNVASRRAAEMERIETAKMEGIGTLAAGVAHDFNNVLGGILGYASMIKSSVFPGDPVYRYTDIIERSAERASEMTERLLGYARRARTQVTRVWLGELVDEVLSLLVQDLDRHRIHLFRDLPEGLPPLAADAGQLHQVLLNLFINARDAMSDGGELTIRARRMDFVSDSAGLPRGKAPGCYVQLNVADTGQGMPREVRERVFEPYFSTKREGGGTGLGLAMVWGIVTGHGGWIDVQSEPGKGSVFQVYLPAMQSPPAVTDAPLDVAVTPLVLAGTPDPSPQTAPDTILVVDDETILLEMAREILENAGYKVLLAHDGVDAVETYRAHGDAIALVILDIVMPRMGGKEAFRQIRKMNPNARVVVCSTFSRHGQAHDLLEAGANEFIQKPYRADAMLKVIRQVLDRIPHPAAAKKA